MLNNNKHLKIFIFILLISSIGNLIAQNLSGRILDSKTKTPIPFVSILFNEASQQGTVSNIDGFFTISFSNISNNKLHFSCMSYLDTAIYLQKGESNIEIYLKKEMFEIPEFHVLPKENPAFVILKKVHKNRSLNNPENISKFKCKEYSQTILKYDVSDINENSSKPMQRLANESQDKDMLFFETIYQRTYNKSTSHSIKVKATRFPGMNKVPIYLPNDMIQPFHFYNDYVMLGEKKYLNPIGDRNFSRYYFHLKDSMMVDGVQTYIIDYSPKSKLNYEVIVGRLIISSANWAIQSVTARPNRKDNITVSILQNYKQVNGQWFPIELNYELKYIGMTEMPPFSYITKTYISDVEIGKEVSVNMKTHNQIYVEEDAASKDSLYWNQNRPIELNQRQINSFTNMDTLGNFDNIPFMAEKLGELKLAVSIFDIDLTKLYSKNSFEGKRYGLGLSTNERLSQRISIGGFLLYGSEDKEYKYGGNIELNIAKRTNFKTYFSYNHSYIKDEYFLSNSYQNNNISIPNSIYNQDFLTEYKIGFKNDFRRININYYAASQSYQTFSLDSNLNNLNEDIFAGGIHFYFDYYKKNMSSWVSPYKSINSTSAVENRYIPILEVVLEKGFEFDNYNYDYAKLQLEINSTFFLTKLGRIHYSLQSGKIWGDLAVSKTFRGGKMYAKDATLLFEDAFQTVSQNEFYNTEYLYLFMNYKFGAINFKSRNFLPQVVLYQNLGLGNNNGYSIYQNTQTMIQPLLESGIGVENIFRVSIFNLVYIGGGAAVFCRYGEHALDGGIENNLAYRAIVTISI